MRIFCPTPLFTMHISDNETTSVCVSDKLNNTLMDFSFILVSVVGMYCGFMIVCENAGSKMKSSFLSLYKYTLFKER